MESIKDYYPTPSAAIKGMIDGLNNHEHTRFEVDMDTFGQIREGICYGCAAFAAIQNIMPKSAMSYASGKLIFVISWSNLDTGFNQAELEAFEDSINEFRSGTISRLFDFYDLPAEKALTAKTEYWYLATDDWQKELPKIERYRNKLIALGY